MSPHLQRGNTTACSAAPDYLGKMLWPSAPPRRCVDRSAAENQDIPQTGFPHRTEAEFYHLVGLVWPLACHSRTCTWHDLFTETGLTLAQLCNTKFCQAFHHTHKMLTATPLQYLCCILTTHTGSRLQMLKMEFSWMDLSLPSWVFCFLEDFW